MMLRAASLLLVMMPTPAHADERRYMLSGFDGIRVDGPFDVTVVAGASPNAVASGEMRALDGVSVRIQGRTLVISPSPNAWGGYPGAARARPRVTVTAATLRSAAMVGGGRMTIDRMRGQRIELTVTGAATLAVGDAQAERIDAEQLGTGQIIVGGRALQGRFASNGAGAIYARGLDLAAVTVNWQSAGDGRFTARKTAEIASTGQGAVSVVGDAKCLVRGSGPVECGGK